MRDAPTISLIEPDDRKEGGADPDGSTEQPDATQSAEVRRGVPHRHGLWVRVAPDRPRHAVDVLRRRWATYDWPVLDERDLDIVAALQEDARATYADVAGRVGLSASAVHDRVRKLEQQGVIRGYAAVVDPEALGLFVTALIAASPLDPRQPDDLPDRVAEFPEVEDCFSVAGATSYVLKVRTRTTTDLEDLIRRLREKAQVTTSTTIALSIPFERRPLRP